MKKDNLGKRMKEYYEQRGRHYLNRRIPVILRLDGKSFHTFTKGFTKPFDEHLNTMIVETALFLCENIQGAKIAYSQSDEISIIITDYDSIYTEAWFDYETSKLNSVAASMATAKFNQLYYETYLDHSVGDFEAHTYEEALKDLMQFMSNKKLAFFDCRAFNIPEEEIGNYLRWRYKDWVRNSVTMYAQSVFSHKELHKKSQSDMHEMLHSKGLNWALLDDKWKNGTLICKMMNQKTDKIEWIKASDFSFIIKNNDLLFSLINDIIKKGVQ